MKYRVIILPVAKADINAAAKWIRQNDSPENAKVWVNEINDAVASLDTFPADVPWLLLMMPLKKKYGNSFMEREGEYTAFFLPFKTKPL
ncbi:MAG: type II toxin-antitoxin system RelE/ParE family toxin [Nostoc sp.]|uniref:type II toxin-antitoxin system RelE/ParE family toxin n=1 Tax=Nostoc sp. TaxID=1180 RepID=UPI002FF521A0